MGNNAAVGHAMAMTGLPQAAGFHKTLGSMMYQYNLEPWDPKSYLAANLQKQQELQKTSPLRFVQVADGMQFYGAQLNEGYAGAMMNTLTREKFVEMSQQLFRQKGLHLPPEEARLFYDIFDAIDLYKNGTLSLGELAGGLSSFFGGTVEDKTSAVFNLLAGGGDQVPKTKLSDLLKPYVWSMVPPNADVLRPILLPHVTDELYSDISMSNTGNISRQEMLRWAQRGQFAQGANPNAVNMSFTIIDRAALAISVALQVAWQEYEGKAKLREYGAQTWQESHNGQQQQLADVGATRYVQQAAPGMAASGATVITNVGQGMAPVLANVGQVVQSGWAQGVSQVSSWFDQDDTSPRGTQRIRTQSMGGVPQGRFALGGTTTMTVQPQPQPQQQPQPANAFKSIGQNAFQMPPQAAAALPAPPPQPRPQAVSAAAPPASPFPFSNVNVIPGLAPQQSPQLQVRPAAAVPQAQFQPMAPATGRPQAQYAPMPQYATLPPQQMQIRR